MTFSVHNSLGLSINLQYFTKNGLINPYCELSLIKAASSSWLFNPDTYGSRIERLASRNILKKLTFF